MKTKIQIIITILIVMFGLFMINQHENQTRADYAEAHNCSWTFQGGFDICK